jgi:ActR/RegA family two-component response regulator
MFRMRSVLLVDDDERLLRAWTTQLGTERSVVHATNHTEALACSTRQRIDLAVVDQRLGPERGTDVIEALLAADPNMFVIMTGAYLSARDVHTAGRLQVEFLQKPFNIRLVLDAVEQGNDLATVVSEPTQLTLEAAERRHIELVMSLVGHNVTHAAKMLKISRVGLQNKRRKLGLA